MIYLHMPGKAVVNAAKAYQSAMTDALKAKPTAEKADAAAERAFERLISEVSADEIDRRIVEAGADGTDRAKQFDAERFIDNEAKAISSLLVERMAVAKSLVIDVRTSGNDTVPSGAESIVEVLTDGHRIAMNKLRDARSADKSEKKKAKKEVRRGILQMTSGTVVVSANLFAAPVMPWKLASLSLGVGLIINGVITMSTAS